MSRARNSDYHSHHKVMPITQMETLILQKGSEELGKKKIGRNSQQDGEAWK